MPTTPTRQTVLRRIHLGRHLRRQAGRAGIHRPARSETNTSASEAGNGRATTVASILIGEGEAETVSLLETGLPAGGYATITARTGAQVLALARDDLFDLLILGAGLLDITAERVLRTLRAAGTAMPIIVVGTSCDAAAFLEAGADDHMAKPFRVEELLARSRARLRDAQCIPDALTAGTLEIDLVSRRCAIGHRHVELTPREFALAEVFVRHPTQVLTRPQLARHVWGPEIDTASNVVDVYVGYLRRKLGDDIIHTVRGLGYRLNAG
jgi:DNA-binding response OmpR family regulator